MLSYTKRKNKILPILEPISGFIAKLSRIKKKNPKGGGGSGIPYTPLHYIHRNNDLCNSTKQKMTYV